MRRDGDSSAEEENNFKDYLRKEAKEEKRLEKEASARVKQKELDLKKIEELKFAGEIIPETLRKKYQDDIETL